jgi:plasmid replication initiation protein
MNHLNPDKALVTKSNNLVEARYHFSIWETRVFTKLVSLIQPGDEAFKKYKLQIKDLVSFFGVNDNDAYVKIKAVPDNLLKKVVTIPYTENGEERFLKTGLIAQASIPKKQEGYIELSFHPDLKPYLLQLKRTFLSYDIRNVLKISSVYSVRIYELLKQYEKIGQREFDIDTLKIILGVSDKYKLYGHFKSRIILKAQKDLKLHTDIYFEFTEIKQKRKVIGLVFKIKKNKDSDIDAFKEVKPVVPPLQAKIIKQLKLWGVTQQTLNSYFKKYALEHLQQRIVYVLNQQKIKAKKSSKIENIAAYFNSIVSKKELVDYVEVEKKVQRAKKVKKQASSEDKKRIEASIISLKRKIQQEEEIRINKLFEENESLKSKIMEQVRKNSPLFYSDKSKTNEDYLEDNHLFKAAVFVLVKKAFKKEFTGMYATYEQEIKNLEKKLRHV